VKKTKKKIKEERIIELKTKKNYYYSKNYIVINDFGKKDVSYSSSAKISKIIEYFFKIVGLVANLLAIIQLFKKYFM